MTIMRSGLVSAGLMDRGGTCVQGFHLLDGLRQLREVLR